MDCSPGEHTALVRSGEGGFSLEPRSTGELPPDGVLLQLLYVGICGTDLDIGRHARGDPARILGHEGIGKVIAVGEAVTHASVGERLVLNPVNATNQDEIIGHSFDGLFQQRYLLRDVDLACGGAVSVVPELPSVRGPLVEPLGTAIYGNDLVRRACSPDTIAVMGAGPIGLLNALLAKSNGSNVVVVDRARERLVLAVERDLLDPSEVLLESRHVADDIEARSSGRGVDAVFICTPRATALAALNAALEFVRPYGCIDLVAGFAAGARCDQAPSADLALLRRENVCGDPSDGVVRRFDTVSGKPVWMTGHRGTSAGHLRTAMEMLARDWDAYSPVVSHIVPFSESAAVLNALTRTAVRRLDGRTASKVLFDMAAE